MRPEALFHFSTSPDIERFAPHVPRSNAAHVPAVWAIDAEHAPLYWFPRDCPRVTVWSRSPSELLDFQTTFMTVASRLHAIESGWLPRMIDTTIYRYVFDAEAFVPWENASGQWITDRDVVPRSVSPMGDLLAAHIEASIELRVVPSLWPLHDRIVQDQFDFSMVRMHNALPRPPS